MALKALMLRQRITNAENQLAELRKMDPIFQQRSTELEQAIREAATPEEESAVEASISTYETELNNHKTVIQEAEATITNLKSELAELEAAQPKPPAAPVEGERKENLNTMSTRTKFFGLTHQERDAFMTREDVKGWLQRIRDLGGQKRAVSGADLLIPTIVLDILRENVSDYSKLYKYVRVRRLKGKARQPIASAVPIGIWMEVLGALNELDMAFADVEVDAYKVGGFIPVHNSVLQDSDIALAQEIMTALLQAIGAALDQAILYGTNSKMPLGIVPRLLQTADPKDEDTSIVWKDLHTSNVKTLTGKAGIALFQEIVRASGNAKNKYSSDSKFWAMSDATKTELQAEAMSFNAAAAIASGVDNAMPVIGGTIETFDWMPDGVLVGGYGNLYLLVEREGAAIGYSEHVRYLEDQTVFKGTARYDGMPTIPEGFVVISINGTAPTASAVTFGADKANTAASD